MEMTESRVIEYKEGGFLFKDEVLIQYIRKYASAFLNSEGGKLLAGITDKGVVRGVYISSHEFKRIVDTFQHEMNFFRPVVTSNLFSIRTYPVINEKRTFLSSRPNDLCVLEMRFEKGLDAEIYEAGDHLVYLRRDGGVHGPLRPLDIKNIVISKYNQTLKNRKENELRERDVLKQLPTKVNVVKLKRWLYIF